MLTTLKEPALTQVRKRSPWIRLSREFKVFLIIGFVGALQWPECLCCLGKSMDILSNFGMNTEVLAPYLSMSVVSRALIPSAKGLSGSAEICSYW